MNDEREMILKMLQDGKITVEEANALLDVLNEPDAGAAAAFTGSSGPSADRSAPKPPPPPGTEARGRDDERTDRPHRERPHGTRTHHERHSDEDRPRGSGGPHGFAFDLDLSGLKEGLREAMSAVRESVQDVGQTLKDTFAGMGEFDFAEGFAQAMGRSSARAERTLAEDAGGAATLVVQNQWGDVRVTGTDGSTVTVTARITAWGEDDEAARAVLDEIGVTLVRDGDAWRLESVPGAVRRVRIDYEITVPRSMDVSVTAASGDLWLEHLAGSQRVNTLSGDINVASLGAAPDDEHVFSTKSGDVVAAALVGEVTLGTLSGDVTVDGFTGFLRANSKSGDITVRDGRGSFVLSTLSGDVRAELVEVGTEPIKVSAVSGDVRLEVPEGASLMIDARSTSGGVRVDLDLADATRGKRRVSGAVRGGEIPVTVTSVSGDVSVTGR